MPNPRSGAVGLGRNCLVSWLSLLATVLWVQGVLAEAYPQGRLSGNPTPVAAPPSLGAYSLMHAACDSEVAWTEAMLALSGEALSLLCGPTQMASNPTSSQDESALADIFPALEWKSIQETVRLRPTAGASVGMTWFGTYDGEVSVLNLPIIGTNLLSMSSGLVNFGSAAGVGLGGVYAQFGLELPLYYKYPKFWSLNFVLGTIYNLGFFLNETWESTGIWGGGPKFILELGILRITTTFGVGYAGRYCRSFLCDAGVGGSISLNFVLIEETTGLPRQYPDRSK